MVVLSRHPPLRSQGARHSQPAGDGGEPLLGAVPAQMAIAVSLEARLSRPVTSRTPPKPDRRGARLERSGHRSVQFRTAHDQ